MFVVKCGMVHTRCGDTWGVDKKVDILGIWTWKMVIQPWKIVIWYDLAIKLDLMGC